MPRPPALRAGIGAKGDCLKRFLHPRADRIKIWAVDDKQRVGDLEVGNKSEKRVSKKIQKVYDVRVPGHPDVALYASTSL